MTCFLTLKELLIELKQVRPAQQSVMPLFLFPAMNYSSLLQELRHRGELAVEAPDGELWAALGGRDGVEALIGENAQAAELPSGAALGRRISYTSGRA